MFTLHRYGILGKRFWNEFANCQEFALRGDAWENANSWGIHGRAMLVHLLKKANELGWQLICSLDVSAKIDKRKGHSEFPIDVHSWFLCKPPQNDPNLPFAPPISQDPPSYTQAMT